jgi:hypothetical protein
MEGAGMANYWTKDQTDQLRNLVAAGKAWIEISEAIGRSPHSVKERWRTIHRTPFERKEREYRAKANRKVKRRSRDEVASEKLLKLLQEHHDFSVKIPPGYSKPAAPEQWIALHSVLDAGEPPAEKYPQVARIKRVVGEHFGVTPLEIDSSRRDKMIVQTRQIAMYLAKQLTPRSFPSIGKRFGKDHTTVIHSVRSIEHRLRIDPVLAAKIEHMKEVLQCQ